MDREKTKKMRKRLNDIHNSEKGPYHSVKPGKWVYHRYEICTVGNNIERENRKSGEGGRKLCKRCKGLEEETIDLFNKLQGRL